MNARLHTRPTLLALSLAFWLGHSPLAFSAPTLGASTAASSNGSAGVENTSSSPGYQNSSTYAPDGVYDPYNSASAYAFSSSSGAYAVSSYATGYSGSGNAFASFLNTVVNNSGVAQQYSMTFKIYGGSLSTSAYAALDQDEYLRSGYAASIKVNNQQIWFSAASIDNTGGTTTSSKSGTDLNSGDDGDDGYYSWGATYVTIDLGILDPNESMDVLAELSDNALSNVGVYSYSNGGGYDSYGGYNNYCGYGEFPSTLAFATVDTGLVEGCVASKGNASAFYGDPLEIDADPLAFAVTANAVPEPGSLALLALAGGAAALARRRRRDS